MDVCNADAVFDCNDGSVWRLVKGGEEMNKRLKNKAEKRRRQQICEALELCLQINGLQESDQEFTGNHPTAFLRFTGHVASLDVSVFRQGWKRWSSPSDKMDACITDPAEVKQLISWLKELKKELLGCNRESSTNK